MRTGISWKLETILLDSSAWSKENEPRLEFVIELEKDSLELDSIARRIPRCFRLGFKLSSDSLNAQSKSDKLLTTPTLDLTQGEESSQKTCQKLAYPYFK